jgi:hypothetical protein
MLNFEKASKILEDHFANLTDEEFITNLKEYCPRIFDKNNSLDQTDLAQHSNGTKEVTNGSTSDLKKANPD